MPAMKTPGVYTPEKQTFPHSAVEAATAVPAFIGYTEKAQNGDLSLLNKPFRITSMYEYHIYFGGAPKPMFTIAETADFSRIRCGNKGVSVKRSDTPFILYYNMLMFYANGGGTCYIVSVGDYSADEISSEALHRGVDALLEEQEPTMVVVPEAVCLPDAATCSKLQQHILEHCGSETQSRFAILDVFNGYKDMKEPENVIEKFRSGVDNFMSFGAAYYP